jgi:type IV secretory pathway VirB9-like protein
MNYKKLLSILIFSFFFVCVFAITTTKTLTANYNGGNEDIIYKVNCKSGFATAFELPRGKDIKEFVIGDPKFWKAEASGRFGFVKPFNKGLHTSLSIITTEDEIFVFSLVENSSSPVVAKVKIEKENEDFFKNKMRKEIREKVNRKAEILKEKFERELEKQKEEIFRDILFSINKNYRITNNTFNIKSVVDNGIFTYILFGNTQEKPAVYIATKNKIKEFEPIKYVEKNGYYEIHRVITGKEKIFLKSGKKITKIEKKR